MQSEASFEYLAWGAGVGFIALGLFSGFGQGMDYQVARLATSAMILGRMTRGRDEIYGRWCWPVAIIAFYGAAISSARILLDESLR